MKKSILILAISFVFIKAFGQRKDCCDSVLNILNNSKCKRMTKSVSLSKTSDLTINIDNSQYANNNLSIPSNTNKTERTEQSPPLQPSSNFFDTELLKELLKIGVTIFLALLAGVLALFQMKANIISSARIRWIEDLRSTLSILYPTTLNVVNSYQLHVNLVNQGTQEKANADARYLDYCNNLTDFNSLSNKVRMQLNSNEPNHKNIEIILDRIDKRFNTEKPQNINLTEIEDELRAIVVQSKLIFKEEWERAKRISRI